MAKKIVKKIIKKNHFVCCSIEKGHYSCYICRTQDAIDSIDIDIPNLVQRDKENVIKNEIKDKTIIVKEEEKKKVSKKNDIKNLIFTDILIFI